MIAAYREPDRTRRHELMTKLIDSVSTRRPRSTDLTFITGAGSA
jgi:hypothetical protein